MQDETIKLQQQENARLRRALWDLRSLLSAWDAELPGGQERGAVRTISLQVIKGWGKHLDAVLGPYVEVDPVRLANLRGEDVVADWDRLRAERTEVYGPGPW